MVMTHPALSLINASFSLLLKDFFSSAILSILLINIIITKDQEYVAYSDKINIIIYKKAIVL
jgi:hypothetical protein